MQRKLIIEAFGQPELADDSSIIADVYYVCPTCTKPNPMFTCGSVFLRSFRVKV